MKSLRQYSENTFQISAYDPSVQTQLKLVQSNVSDMSDEESVDPALGFSYFPQLPASQFMNNQPANAALQFSSQSLLKVLPTRAVA